MWYHFNIPFLTGGRDLLVSFVVAIVSWWNPLNATSFLLAYTSVLLAFLYREGTVLMNRIERVSCGICGTGQLDSDSYGTYYALRQYKIDSQGFDSPPSHQGKPLQNICFAAVSFYLPPAAPNSARLYSGAMICK